MLPGYNTDHADHREPAVGLGHARRLAEAARRAARRLQPLLRDLLPRGPELQPGERRSRDRDRPARLRPALHLGLGLRADRLERLAAARPHGHQLPGLRQRVLQHRAPQLEVRRGLPQDHDRPVLRRGLPRQAELRRPRDVHRRHPRRRPHGAGDSNRNTAQNSCGPLRPGQLPGQPSRHLQLRAALGLLRCHQRGREPLQPLRRDRRGQREAGQPALPEGLEQPLAARERGVGHQGRRPHGRARILRALLRRLLGRLLLGQLPFNTFNPGPAYNDIEFSFSPAAAARARGARLHRLRVLRRLHRGPEAQDAVRAELQRERPAADRRSTPRSRSATSARRAAGSSATATSTSPIRPWATTPTRTSSTSTSSSRPRVSHYNSLQDLAQDRRTGRGSPPPSTTRSSKSTDTASDGQDFVPERLAARRQPPPREGAGAVQLRRAPPLRGLLHLEHRIAHGQRR